MTPLYDVLLIRLALNALTTMLGGHSPQQLAPKKLPGDEPRDLEWRGKLKHSSKIKLGSQDLDPRREASFGFYQNLLRVAKKLQGVDPSEVKPFLE